MKRRDFLKASTATVFLAACDGATAPRSRTRYLALGDSVTEQRMGVVPYPPLLHDALADDGIEQLTNAGVSGCTTRQILDQWADRVTTPCPSPDLVTVMFGINDHTIDVGATDPRVPLDSFHANLLTICGRLNGLASRPAIVLLTATYIERDSVARLREYNAVTRAIGLELGLPVVDCYAPMAELAGPDWRARWTMNGDGVHPNSEAQRILEAAIFPAVFREIAH